MASGTKSPFGNGNGGMNEGRAAPNNFLQNPGGNAGSKGRDVMATQGEPDTTGEPENAESVPAGGKIPIVESPEANRSMPFKLGGGE